jgi:N-acetylglucosaminyldiphosphoundecaprenol N-acetyl-beta-D-mannosaminyltransferase
VQEKTQPLNLESSDLFGIKVHHCKLEDIQNLPNSLYIVTLNFEILVNALYDDELKTLINQADLVIPDGVFITLLLFVKKAIFIKKIAGIDLAEYLIQKYSQIAFLGAEKDVISKLEKIFTEKMVFAHHGFFEENSEEEKILVEKIAESKPELLLVALGSPRQEKFISRNQKIIENTIKIGVGGAFDIWALKYKRAPKWMRIFCLEWFFRIIQEPYRLSRFLYNVNRFFHLLLK